MTAYLNETGLPLSVAAYLAADFYDHVPNTLSATALLKPTRQLILGKRVPKELQVNDLQSMVKSRIGTSIHDGVEKVWLGGHYEDAMRSLGYDESTIERIVVNPAPSAVQPGQIPVYLEQRMFREHMGHRVSGKFDFIGDGHLQDVKTTSVFSYIYDTKTEDYQLQGSIYRWLDQGQRITEDYMSILFIFTDWMAGKAKMDKNYPPNQAMQKKIPLLSLDDTEDYISNKLSDLAQFKDTDEPDLPRCSDKELWRKPATYKYYKDGNPNAARSTKNFDNPGDAYARQQKDGGGGIVVEKPGEVIACRYCPAFPICTQKDEYLAEGSLTL